MSRKKNATIPWNKLSSNPSAWIRDECFPSGFQWADPSKIRVDEVFQLLDHWKQRQKDGLTPLIWNPSCELLADVDQYASAQHVRNLKKKGHPNVNDRETDSDTEEEDFGNELGRIPSDSSSSSSTSSQSPSPSPSPSPLHRHNETERTSTPGMYFTYSLVIILIYTHLSCRHWRNITSSPIKHSEDSIPQDTSEDSRRDIIKSSSTR